MRKYITRLLKFACMPKFYLCLLVTNSPPPPPFMLNVFHIPAFKHIPNFIFLCWTIFSYRQLWTLMMYIVYIYKNAQLLLKNVSVVNPPTWGEVAKDGLLIVMLDVLKASGMTEEELVKEVVLLETLFTPHRINSSLISFSGSLMRAVINCWATRVDSADPLSKTTTTTLTH